MAPPIILLADDEKDLVTAVTPQLERKGYRVLAAYDGQQALAQVEAERPDLILLDIAMPVMDGYSCLRELNNRYGPKAIPVVILTAREGMQDLFQLEGVEDYIVKPFDMHDLLARVAHILQRRAEGRNP